jgi:type I restriction enzyme S subunit
MSNWVNTTLGEMISIGNGKIQTGPFGSQLHSSDYVENGIPCIMPANMQNNRVNLNGIARITEEDANRLSKHLVKSGDIVYSRRGDVTQKALISKIEEGYFCGTGCLLIKPGEKLDSEFLTYYLSTPISQNWIVKQAVGATMPNLNTSILANIPLKIPPKAIQRKIASVLSAIDAKIELNNLINAELEAMAKTLYDYWFVQFDFPDANGKPYKTSGGKMVYNAKLKREIPEGWVVKKVGDYADVLKGDLITAKDTKEGDFKVVAAGVDFSYTHADFNRAKNTITISGSGANAGFINFWREPIFASDCITVRGATDTETLLLLHHLSFIQNHILNQATGSAQPHVYPSDIRILDYAIPKDFLIDDFGEFAIPMNNQIAKNSIENQLLVKLRDWLLPMLMNGQVTVR